MMHANAFVTQTEQTDFSDPADMRDKISVESGYQSTLERDVVVRRLRGAADPRLRARFIREVKALAGLRHHNFVHVYDAGVKDDVPFAVFERLRGITVQHRLDLLADQQARMELDEAVGIVESVAGAVSYARRQGVRVHDVTPGNIVLAEDRRVVLTGLGEPLPENPLTAAPALLAYAAPERLFGAPAAGADEVYALGVLLAHLVFGQLPYAGSAIGIIAQKQQLASLPVLSDAHAALACPYPLAALMHQATAADPRDRPADVERFCAALRAAAGGRQSPPLRAQPAPRPLVGLHTEPAALRYAPRAAEEPYLERAVGEPYLERAVGEPYTDETAPVYVRRAAQPAPLVEARAAAVAAPAAAQAVVAPEAAQALVALEAAIAEPEAYDPLTPGLDNPALAAALAYTILVPMPVVAEDAAPTRVALQQNVFRPQYVLVLMMLCVLAIGAAMMFG